MVGSYRVGSYHAVAMAILAIALCLNLSEGEEQQAEAVSSAFADGEQTAPPLKESNSFNKIPFFLLKDGAEKVDGVKTQATCQKACVRQTKCRSFSFSVRKEDCLVSPNTLGLNSDFTFYSKRINPGEKDKYRDFAGLMYQSKTWTRYMGKTAEECRKFCDTGKDSKGRHCNGYSYRSRDKTCLLSPFGVNYDNDYDYFERIPAKVKVKTKVVDAKGDTKTVTKTKTVIPAEKFKPKQNPGPSKQYKAEMARQEGEAKIA